MGRRGVVVANTGSPAAPTPEAVGAYLAEFLSDPRICPLNPLLWRLILHAFILPRRSKASAEKYARVWTEAGSPLSAGMASLAARLDALDDDIAVRHAMSYGTPSMLDALVELHEAGCTAVTVVPLYPQSAHSTTLVVRDRLDRALRALDWSPTVAFVDRYVDEPAYLDALAQSVRDAGLRAGDRLLVAFHSIPMADIEAGDSYGEQASATAHALAARLGLADGEWALGYQCRFDKGRRWLGPFTSEAIESLGSGYDRIFVVTPNFSIDCLETIYDIDIELRRRLAEGRGAASQAELVRVPCLNDSDAQVRLVMSLVRQQG